MIMDSAKIVETVNALIALRNTCRQAIAAQEQIVEVPAVPASDSNPGKPAWKKPTGQLPNAANNLFVAATNLIGHLKNLSPDAPEIAVLEKALNAPLPPAAPAAQKSAVAGQPGASAVVK